MADKSKILAIDDDPVVLKLLASILNPVYELQIAKSAKEALKLMAQQKPDLILLDIGIPIISGFEFLHMIRRNPESKDIPVIIVSGFIETEFIIHAENEGISGMVGKPIQKDDLLSKIEQALNSH